MFAQAGRLARGSGAPAHGSLSKVAAPVRSPVSASVKRVSPAPYTAAAPARSASASAPCAVVGGNGTSRSPDSYDSTPDSYGEEPMDVLAFMEAAAKEGMNHAFFCLPGAALTDGVKNVPPDLMAFLADFDASAEGFVVQHGPWVGLDKVAKTMGMPVFAQVVHRGSECWPQDLYIKGKVRNNGRVEHKLSLLKECLKKMGGELGDWLLLSWKPQGGPMFAQLRLLRKEAVTKEVRAAMESFLVVPPAAGKQRGQKAKQQVGGAALRCAAYIAPKHVGGTK